MGYVLNKLANLPVDDSVRFYIFVINGQFQEPLYKIIQDNFVAVARSIGDDAVIAMGAHPESFGEDVIGEYLGHGIPGYHGPTPALLITDAHPSKLTDKSLRLLVPLQQAEERFGKDWNRFFTLLSKFVRGESDEFLKQFEKSEDLSTMANKLMNIRPGIFGISFNVNEAVTMFQKWRAKNAH